MLQRATSSLLVVAVLCLALPAFAQEITGTVTGTVTDNTGAVLPGAHESDPIGRITTSLAVMPSGRDGGLAVT